MAFTYFPQSSSNCRLQALTHAVAAGSRLAGHLLKIPRAAVVAAGLMGLAVVALATFSTPALSRTTLDLDTAHQPVALHDWGDFWVDPTGQLNAAQANAVPASQWRPAGTSMVYEVTANQALWLRFTVPPAPDAERWYLEVPYAAINRVVLYTLDSADHWGGQEAGDQIAVNKWPVPHRHPLLPIALSAEVPTQYLLRFEHGHRFGASLQFVNQSYLNNAEQRVSLILGIFFGLTGLAAVVSAMSALSLRDPAYGFYAVSVTLMGLTQAALTGVAGLHLWPLWPWWNDISISVLPALELAAGLMFISAAVSLPERSAWLHRCMVGLAAVGVAVAVAVMLVPMAQRRPLFLSYIFLPQLLMVYANAWAWRRGDRFAPWLLLGMLPVIVATAYTTARYIGLVPVGFLTQHGMQIGSAIALPTFMLILMLRSQHRRENIRRIQGLDRIDPTTGLINAHVFGVRLTRMIARSERLKQQSAVMLIDIVNTEQVQRDFGRKIADELPLRVAERVLSTAREIDSAARLSDRRFGMLVEGPFRAEDAATLGPRLVARCLMPYKGLHMNCVAQVRVAYALVPYQGSNAQGVLAKLDERLTQTSHDDKKAVFMLGEILPPVRRSRTRRASDRDREIAPDSPPV